jgi:hypothetical protein
MGKIRKSFSLFVVSLMLLQGALTGAGPAGATPVDSNSTSTTSTNPPVDTESSDPSSNTSTSTSNEVSDNNSNTEQNSSGGSNTESTNNNENTGSTGNSNTNTNPENNEGTGSNNNSNSENNNSSNEEVNPLDALNEARVSKSEAEILAIIKSPEWLELPEGFENLQPDDQLTVARAVKNFIPGNNKYMSNGEVQFALNVGYESLLVFLQTDQKSFAQHLDSFYILLSKVSSYTSLPQYQSVEQLGQKYISLSDVDKQLLFNIAQRFTNDKDILTKNSYNFFIMLLMQYSPVNSSDGIIGMVKALMFVHNFQQLTEEMHSTKNFPLDFTSAVYV